MSDDFENEMVHAGARVIFKRAIRRGIKEKTGMGIMLTGAPLDIIVPVAIGEFLDHLEKSFHAWWEKSCSMRPPDSGIYQRSYWLAKRWEKAYNDGEPVR